MTGRWRGWASLPAPAPAILAGGALVLLALDGGVEEAGPVRLLAAKPKAPGNVRVDRVTETAIKLRWKDRVRGERRYEPASSPATRW